MKRTTAVISARVPVHLKCLADLHAKDTGCKRADVVEEALTLYLDAQMVKPRDGGAQRAGAEYKATKVTTERDKQ